MSLDSLGLPEEPRPCYVCGAPLLSHTDSIEGTILEESRRCGRCGYQYEFVTGYTEEEIDGRRWEWTWTESPQEAEKRMAEQDEVLKAARERRKYQPGGGT